MSCPFRPTLLIGLFAIALAAQPYVIAHRGASGHLPEHTLAAYALAIGQGAHFIEPDVVMTKDDQLVCLHDLTLDRVTDVGLRFPGRARPDGRSYAIDFTLAEIKSLALTGPAETALPGLQIATLREMIALVQALEQRLGRELGIIPEAKAPRFHQEAGKDLVVALHGELSASGYRRASDRAIIQCFEREALAQFHALGSQLRLVWLVSELPSADELDRARPYLHGLGPSRRLLEAGAQSPLLATAKARQLALYPWTYGDDEGSMTKAFHELQVAGLFTDFPATGVRALAGRASAPRR